MPLFLHKNTGASLNALSPNVLQCRLFGTLFTYIQSPTTDVGGCSGFNPYGVTGYLTTNTNQPCWDAGDYPVPNGKRALTEGPFSQHTTIVAVSIITIRGTHSRKEKNVS